MPAYFYIIHQTLDFQDFVRVYLSLICSSVIVALSVAFTYGEIKLNSSVTAVSYTHLDVYKRQAIGTLLDLILTTRLS